MTAVAAIADPAVCRNCHVAIGPKDSHFGYCFTCLLDSALGSSGLAEDNGTGGFDPYEIVTNEDGSLVELGRGSMGITYRAIDTNLQLPVALKIIDFKAAGQEINRERFLREARAAARLRHPHVASVLYYGVANDGQCFYAMELVEGETLAERVRRSGPLPVTDALEVTDQVASALEAAEKNGLVHRDLKPANLMLVDEPGINVKVIDFGLAKTIGSQEPSDRITHDGFVGTPAFASPEQFSGDSIDQRSDYFSLGSTLFYLLTGSPPFKTDRVSELAELMVNRTPIIDQLKAARIPVPARELVASLLSAAPEHRPQNGTALAEAIAECQRAIARPKESKRFDRKSFRTIAAALAVLMIGAALLFLFGGIFAKDNAAKSIAVLPFDNLSPMGDRAYFADGVQDEILTNLAKLTDLQVISRSSVQSYKNPNNRPLPGAIAQALHVRYLVNGSVQREGDRIRLTAQLVEARTGRELWADRYDGELTDVFAIQTRLAKEISKELHATLSSAEKASLEEAPTRDFAAYELYLRAKELLANYNEETQGWEPLYTAVLLLNEATTRDPAFALAWCALAGAHDNLYWFNADHSSNRRAAAETALQKALSLRPDLGEIHLALAVHLWASTRDNPAIRRELEIAQRTLPNSASLLNLMAIIDSHQGRWLDALRNYDKAVALDPKNDNVIMNRNTLYEYHRQYDDLRRAIDAAVRAEVSTNLIDLMRTTVTWDEKGDTSVIHNLFDDPSGSLRTTEHATLARLDNALAERNFATAENVLAADPKQEFESGDRRFVCRDFLLGRIKAAEGDVAGAKAAFAKARPFQLAYVQKWPDDPNPLLVLAITDANLGSKEDALREGRQSAAMRTISQDAIEGPTLATDLAQLYLLVGERELAIQQLEGLEQVPGALAYGPLAKMPEWDALRNEPRFQQLLSWLKPIPIINRPELANNSAD